MAVIEKRASVGKFVGGIFVHETFDATDIFVGPDGKPIGGQGSENVENVFTDETERTNATYLAGDVGKVYLQASDNTLWLLTNHDPQTWMLLGGSEQVFNYVYTTEVERTTKVYTNADIGKIARQTDDNSLWVLVAVDGGGNGTWVQLLTSELLGEPNGVASLDGSGKLPVSQMPDIDGTKITGNLDGSKVTGTLNLAQIPAAALERLTHTANESTRLSLTSANVQNGDTVQQDDTGILYIVVDIDNASPALRFVEYTAGTAAAVPWTGVTNPPATYEPSAHTADSHTGKNSAFNKNFGSQVGEVAEGNHNHTLVTAAETANKIRIGAPTTPANGDIWIEPV